MNHRTTPCCVKPLRVIGAVIGGLFLIAFFALALGAVVMVLWNWLMPSLFGLGAITYWQGFGILVFAQLLFGSHIGGHRNEHKYRHDHPPIPEGPLFDKWWAREGKAAFEDHIRHTCTDVKEPTETAPENE
jgi:hypothetical protein